MRRFFVAVREFALVFAAGAAVTLLGVLLAAIPLALAIVLALLLLRWIL